MKYTIEKNHPVTNEFSGKPPTYPFKDMEIGDSFVFPLKKRGAVASAAYLFGGRHNKKFITRKVTESEARCWRTE